MNEKSNRQKHWILVILVLVLPGAGIAWLLWRVGGWIFQALRGES